MHVLLQAGVTKEAGGQGAGVPCSPTACMSAGEVLLHRSRFWQAQSLP